MSSSVLCQAAQSHLPICSPSKRRAARIIAVGHVLSKDVRRKTVGLGEELGSERRHNIGRLTDGVIGEAAAVGDAHRTPLEPIHLAAGLTSPAHRQCRSVRIEVVLFAEPQRRAWQLTEASGFGHVQPLQGKIVDGLVERLAHRAVADFEAGLHALQIRAACRGADGVTTSRRWKKRDI